MKLSTKKIEDETKMNNYYQAIIKTGLRDRKREFYKCTNVVSL